MKHENCTQIIRALPVAPGLIEVACIHGHSTYVREGGDAAPEGPRFCGCGCGELLPPFSFEGRRFLNVEHRQRYEAWVREQPAPVRACDVCGKPVEVSPRGQHRKRHGGECSRRAALRRAHETHALARQQAVTA